MKDEAISTRQSRQRGSSIRGPKTLQHIMLTHCKSEAAALAGRVAVSTWQSTLSVADHGLLHRQASTCD